MKRKTIIISVIAAFNFFPALALAATYKYVPMETIPGFGNPTDFPSYVSAVYKFGLWTIGVSAMLMIVLGGYMYLVSAGNASQTGKAKGIIVDALVGLALALTSWLLLYTINPDLVSFQSLNSAINDAAQVYNGTYPTITATMPANCKADEWKTVFENAAASTGVDKCLIQATAAIESGCNQVPSRTQGGRDCSVMQIAAQANCGTSCDELEANPQKAAECAANYLKSCSSRYRNSPDEQKVRDTYAGYNGGCGALAASSSCAANQSVWQCV